MKTHMVSLQCMSLKGLQTQMALERNTMGWQLEFASPLELLWSSASYRWVSVLLLWCLGCPWRLLNFQIRSPRIGLCGFNRHSHRSHRFRDPFWAKQLTQKDYAESRPTTYFRAKKQNLFWYPNYTQKNNDHCLWNRSHRSILSRIISIERACFQ